VEPGAAGVGYASGKVSYCVGEVRDALGKVSYCVGEVGYGVGKVSYRVGEVGYALGKVSYLVSEVEDGIGEAGYCVAGTSPGPEVVQSTWAAPPRPRLILTMLGPGSESLGDDGKMLIVKAYGLDGGAIPCGVPGR